MEKWFICIDENIQGPYGTEELKAQLSGQIIDPNAYIWGRHQEQWLKPDAWLNALGEMIPNVVPLNLQEQRQWHYAYEGDSFGPVPESRLVSELKKLANIDTILLWSKGMKKWESIFEFHNFVEALGYTRRAHPRAEIDGSVVLSFDDQICIGNLQTISVGGFGAVNLSIQIRRGQELKVELKSPHFYEPISATATVQSINEEGFTGLKFVQINMESQSKIIQYIKKYEESRFNEVA